MEKKPAPTESFQSYHVSFNQWDHHEKLACICVLAKNLRNLQHPISLQQCFKFRSFILKKSLPLYTTTVLRTQCVSILVPTCFGVRTKADES